MKNPWSSTIKVPLLLGCEIDVQVEVDVRVILLQIHLQTGHFLLNGLSEVALVQVLVHAVQNLPQPTTRLLLRLQDGRLEVHRKPVPGECWILLNWVS